MGSKVSVAVLIFVLSAGAAQAAAVDPAMGGPGVAAHGEVLFKQRCGVCHQTDPGKNGVGPALANAFGRKAGLASGYTYSDGLKASGILWTPEKLNQWIQKPESLVPTAKMKLAPVSQAQDRADIIAYLKSKSTNTVAAAPAAPAAAKPKKKVVAHKA